MLLTFDLDGVLIKNPFSTGVFPEVTNRLSTCGYEPSEIKKWIVSEAVSRLSNGDVVGGYDWDDIVRVVANRLGYFDPIPIAELVEKYCVEPHIYLYEGVEQTLRELSEEGYRLVALTNGFLKYQHPVLKALGISKFFTQVITPEKVGCGKPDRRFFSAAKTNSAEAHVHIGDNVIHDVFGANRAGAISIWVYHNLPEDLKALTPAQRANHNRLPQLLHKEIVRDICPEICPEASWSNSVPNYVISQISETVGIVDSEAQKAY